MTTPQSPAPVKKPTRAFPIRVGVLLPLIAMVAGVWLYFALLFDGHMRWILQKGLTFANGAEANVAGFHTDFSQARMVIRGIQMTDDQEPVNNWLQINEIRYALDWNGLLRAKFVVDDASIIGIGLNVPRKTPGFVTPKEPEPLDEGKKSAVLTAAQDYLEESGAGTFFDDLASLKSGVDVKKKLQEMKAQLASEQKIQDLQTQFATYKSGWEATQAKLKSDPEFAKIESDLNGLKNKQIKTPQELAAAVKEGDQLKKLIEKKVAEVQAIGRQGQEQVNTLDEGTSALPGLVQEDIKSLQGQLKLPDIKVEDLSGVIFGKDVMATVNKALFYYKKGQNLYATVKSKAPDEKNEEVPVHERGKGRTYEFPILNQTFPLFYVKHSELSVFEQGQTNTEAVRGVLTHLSSSPELVSEPIKLAFSGNMTASGITGISGEALFDHRHEDFKESFGLAVAQIPVAEHLLSQSKEVKVLLKKASMALDMKGHVTAADMGFENIVKLNQTAFLAEAEGKDLQRILAGVLGDIDSTQLKMKFAGPWNGLKLDVTSDLGRTLQKALRAQFDKEVAKMRQDVEAFVQARIQVERDKLNAELDKTKREVAEFEKKHTDLLKSYEGEANRRLEEAKQQIEGRVDEAKKKAEADAKAKAEEELKKKMKGLKFPK